MVAFRECSSSINDEHVHFAQDLGLEKFAKLGLDYAGHPARRVAANLLRALVEGTQRSQSGNFEVRTAGEHRFFRTTSRPKRARSRLIRLRLSGNYCQL